MIHKSKYVKGIIWDKIQTELLNLSRDEIIDRYWAGKVCSKQDEITRATAPNSLRQYSLVCPDSHFSDRDSILKKLKFAFTHYNDSQKVDVLWEDEEFVAFKYTSKEALVMPKNCVELEDAVSYDALNTSEIAKLMNGTETSSASLMRVEDTNYNKMQTELTKAKENLELAEKKAQEEMEALQEEFRKKELELRHKQAGMLAEFRKMKDQLEDRIFLLEMDIFALRSFFGETYSLQHIIKGKNASEDIPLVIAQKFRYLDEEFARLAGISSFDTKQYSIDNVFTDCKELVDTFVPSQRCITFFKTSKDSKAYSYDWESDCLEQFQMLHGAQIGMLMRNGENVYLSFIDEEITLKDNLFISNATQHEEVPITPDNRISDSTVRPVFSRKLIFLILQRVIDASNIYSDLRGQNLFNSEKILLADSDNQIIYYKYPDFAAFWDRDDKDNIKEGDEIFILESHRGSKLTDIYSRYEEHRGVGYKNTARDADIRQGLSKINMITVEQLGHKYKKPSEKYWKCAYITAEDINKLREEGYVVQERTSTHYYVSCKREVYGDYEYKQYNNVSRINNANLRIYEDEFMSVMWLNSNYVNEWIDTKHIGSWRTGNYTYFVSKLKELKRYLEDREQREASLLRQYISNVASDIGTGFIYTNQLKDDVLEWRMQNNVRRLTDFQAKRFAKQYLIKSNILVK